MWLVVTPSPNGVDVPGNQEAEEVRYGMLVLCCATKAGIRAHIGWDDGEDRAEVILQAHPNVTKSVTSRRSPHRGRGDGASADDGGGFGGGPAVPPRYVINYSVTVPERWPSG